MENKLLSCSICASERDKCGNYFKQFKQESIWCCDHLVIRGGTYKLATFRYASTGKTIARHLLCLFIFACKDWQFTFAKLKPDCDYFSAMV